MRLLLIEDSADDAELIVRELEQGGFQIESHRVDTRPELEAALDQPWDMIISDFAMPQFDGLSAFATFKRRNLDTPFIFVSGVLGEERAVDAMRVGAKDYVLKSKLDRLLPVVQREIDEAANRRSAEAAAHRHQRRLALAVEIGGAAIFEHSLPLGPDTYHSPLWCQILGLSDDQLPKGNAIVSWLEARVHPDDWPQLRRAYTAMIDGHTERYDGEFRVMYGSNDWLDIACVAKAITRDDHGRAARVLGVIRDLTERKSLEAELRQAQRMEAIGRLAGGVAHDFNNLLTVIGAHVTFLSRKLHVEDPARRDVEAIADASSRAEGLTRQLLAFSRRQVAQVRVLSIGDLITGLDSMLRRLLGEDIELHLVLADDLDLVEIDPSHVEQIVLNLAVNARDAMPSGGVLTIEAGNVVLDEAYCARKHAAVVPGPHVMLAVSDTGSGIDEATLRHIFEPFFTTKQVGKGTGLGLSTVFGVTKQAGGYVWAYSEPGEGSTFRVYLPRSKQPATPAPQKPRLQPSEARHTETILLVEDDALVRRASVRILKEAGYTVLIATDGQSAVELARSHRGVIHAMLTDVVMPRMNGPELADRVATVRPEMKVVYMSGYTRNAIDAKGVLPPGFAFVTKPFTPAKLLQSIRALLD